MAEEAVGGATASDLPSMRKRYFRVFAIVMLVLGLLTLVWWFFFTGHSETTEDAYVRGDVAAITPLVNGAVSRVEVSETQAVHKGDTLVTIDSADAKVAVAQAQAELQQVERKVRGYMATDAGLGAQERARRADTAHAQAEIEQARAAYDKARVDLSRRLAVVGDGAVSGEEVTIARNALAIAKTGLASAQASAQGAQASESAAAGTRAANETLISGVSFRKNPEIAAAQAKLDAAQLDLDRTILRAPLDGVVAQRQVQVGQRVQSGTTLMTIVPVDKLYVDANFKEDQLRKIKLGQLVTLTSDRYGSNIVFHGKVTGFAGGTGSAFALIPAQNATGNWIKVVQRVPIRITLDPQELKAHPLLVGLSMNATIDLR